MILIIFFSLFGTFLFFHLFRFATEWWEMHQQLKLIPGPTIRETVHYIWRSNLCNQANCAKETRSFFTQNGVKHSGKYGLFQYTSLKHCIVICDARLARQVLASEQCRNMTSLHHYLSTLGTGNGLLTCDYEQSKETKQTFASYFKFSSIKQYIGQAEKHLSSFNLKVEKECILKNDGHCLDILPLISNLTFDIIGETLFGVQFHAQQEPEEHRMVQQMHSMIGYTDRLLVQHWKHLSSNLFSKLLFSLFDLKLFTETLSILRKRDEIHQDGDSVLDTIIQSANLEEKPFFPFNLNRLMEAQGHMTTFLLAAQDSVASTISWLLFQLAHHPNVQTKVQQEIDDFLAVNSEPDDFFALNRLQYLDCCFQESLRLAPMAPYVSRLNSKPFLLQTAAGQITLPANLQVIVDFQVIHRQEEHFSQADQFIPERFLVSSEEASGSSEKASQPYAKKDAFFPFGHGVRSCFGQRYGQMLVKLFIFNLLRQFTVRPVEGTVKPQPVHSIFQQAAHFPLHFAKRTF